MALPINTSPTYTLVIPSTGKEVQYRPFLVKDEKTLLIAQQSENLEVMINSLKEVIKSCIKTPIDVESLATFDLEYIFTQLRAKSVGEIVELKFKCDTCTDEKAVASVNIDLTQLQVSKSPEHSSKIELFEDVGISMKYPTAALIKKMSTLTDTKNMDQIFDVMVECIDFIYTETEVFHSKEQSKEELLEFLNNLTSEQFLKVQKFFETIPKLTKQVEYTCPVCGKKHNKTLEGLASFF